MQRTIGLLGGSFNPIHLGHLQMAAEASAAMGLQRVILLPDGDPPHKTKGLAPRQMRLRMTELAAAGRFEVSPMEVDRPGKTYTVDTLEALTLLYPGVTLYMIIGADTLGQLLTWRNAPRVFELCTFLVFARDGLPMLPVPGANVTRLDAKIDDISSTEVRARVHRGQSLEGFLPQSVEDYIGVTRLYDPPVPMSVKAIRKRLSADHTPGRYQHILGVERTVLSLAARWGFDEKRAGLTGLLHDCAKFMSLGAMNAFVDAQGVRVDGARRGSVALLHAPASMAMARAVYGVTDPEILRAIRYHNTGHAPMEMLDKLLFVADMIEPGRKEYPWTEGLRRMAQEDLDAAVLAVMRLKLEHLARQGKAAHPDTDAAAEALSIEMKDTTLR